MRKEWNGGTMEENKNNLEENTVDENMEKKEAESVQVDSVETASSKEGPVLVNKMSLIFRIVVGGYLLYTAYSLVPAIQNDTSNQKIFFALFTVLFTVVGGFLAIKSIQSLIYGRYIGGAADPATQEAAEEAEETAVTADANVQEEKAGSDKENVQEEEAGSDKENAQKEKAGLDKENAQEEEAGPDKENAQKEKVGLEK